MNPKYREEMIAWGIRTVALIAISVVLALVNRWFGITIAPPPPPNVEVIVSHPDPAVPPTVTVRELKRDR